MAIPWILVLLLCWPAPLWAKTIVSLDLDADGKTETVAIEAQSLTVQSGGREMSVALEHAALAVEPVPLAPRLVLLAVTYRFKGSRCYQFYRYRSRRLEVVPVEVDDDEFADNRVCASGQTQVRWSDLNTDGTAELVVEESLNTGKSVRRRVYEYLDGSFGTVPLLSGLLVDGVPVLAQLRGTYYRAEAIAAIDSLQELAGLRTSPALTINIQGPLPGYQLGLKTSAGETPVTLVSAQRSVDLRRGEQVLTLSVLATGRNGRIIYDSAADLTDPPLVVVGLGRELDGIYRPAPYDPKWSSFEAYLTQDVLVGTWIPVGPESREPLRIEAGGASNAVTLFSHRYALDWKARLGSPFDLALLSEVGSWLIDLRGSGAIAIAPGRCTQESARGNSCTAAGAPVLYRRREEIGVRP